MKHSDGLTEKANRLI